MNGVQGSIGGVCFLSLVSALSLPAARQQAPAGTNWPSFRGPNASGVADGRPLPAEWDVPAFGRVVWKTPVPGPGHSSPVIGGNRLFVSTAISGMNNPELKTGLYGDVAFVKDDTSHRWIVYCLDVGTVLAKNPMGDVCIVSPAIADGTLYFRSRSQVVAVR